MSRTCPRAVIEEQVTNGIAIRMALLYLMLGGSGGGSTDERRAWSYAAAASSIRSLGTRRCARRPIEDGAVADRRAISGEGRRGGRLRRPRSWRRDWWTCTRIFASLGSSTRRPSRPGRAPRRWAATRRSRAMANTDPVADNAAVIHEVRDLARGAGLCDVFPVGAITKGLGGRVARRDGRDGGGRRPHVQRRRELRPDGTAAPQRARLREGVRRGRDRRPLRGASLVEGGRCTRVPLVLARVARAARGGRGDRRGARPGDRSR